MSPLACPDVEEQLDLYAAGACDGPTAAAVARHLAACPACARAHREAERIHALLEMCFREDEGLRRLRVRIEAEPRPRRRAVGALPFLRRALAVAAMLLVAVGLSSLLNSFSPRNLSGSPVTTILWASPEAQYAMSSPGTIDLDAGELWVRVQPGGAKSRPSRPVAVRTPGGVATVEGTEFFVAARQTAVLVTVRDGKAHLANPRGAAEGRAGEVLQASTTEAPRRQVEALSLRFGRHYRPTPVEVGARVPTLKPPFDLSKAVNYLRMAAAFPLEKAAPTLKRDGFAVLPGAGEDDLRTAYHSLHELGVPVVITADAVLHVCRAHFDETLRDLEERVFVPELTQLLRALLDALDRTPPDGTEDGREARARALAYLAVALRALEPNAPLPRTVDTGAVAEVVGAMRRHESGPRRVRLLGREEDFSVYRPQGHYLRSERLGRYHAAMTWLGRTALLLRDGLVAPAEARRQTLAAVLIARALADARLPDGRPARAAWERIDAVTSFSIGLTDDFGPQQYAEALARIGGTLDEAGLRSFKVELAKQAAGVERGGPSGAPLRLLDRLAPDAGFRLFGRRFTPDGYMFERLLYPEVGTPTRQGQFTQTQTAAGRPIRGLPRGLDVMAVLGSRRARELLHELGDDAYRGYDAALAGLRRRFASFDDVDWNRNLYWSWLYALQPLLAERGPGYPPFMSGAAYRTRALNTALASWAHRRQDAALYARKSKTIEAVTLKATLPAVIDRRDNRAAPYVEPLPELYARLLALARMGGAGLREMKVLDGAGGARLARLEKLLQQLQTAAEDELSGRVPAAADEAFLRHFVADPESVAVMRDERRLTQLGEAWKTAQAARDEKRVAAIERDLLAEGDGALTTVSVVTVHTDPNSGQILQEATGGLDVGIFLYRQPDGRVALAAGPVLSYYEFKRPRARPVAEDEWRRMLSGSEAPVRPPWAGILAHQGRR